VGFNYDADKLSLTSMSTDSDCFVINTYILKFWHRRCVFDVNIYTYILYTEFVGMLNISLSKNFAFCVPCSPSFIQQT